MSPHSFATSPSATGEQRKFINPTMGFVGANIFGPDGKPTSIPVEPGGEVWLTPEEERMTAEAPRLAQDNPFIKAWDEVVEYDSLGEPVRTVGRTGTLVLADEAPRPTASDRFIPERGSTEDLRATREAMEGLSKPAPDHEMTEEELTERLAALRARDAARVEKDEGGQVAKDVEPPEETVTGAPPLPEQPPVEGQPSPDEVVGTPEAVAANDEALAQREPTAEQPTRGIPTG